MKKYVIYNTSDKHYLRHFNVDIDDVCEWTPNYDEALNIDDRAMGQGMVKELLCPCKCDEMRILLMSDQDLVAHLL
jgi:hypothetical protein